MHDTLVRLFCYKAWADDQLLAALAELKPESEVTKLAIRALSHTYAVDRIFIAHLSGTEHGFKSANLAPLPALHDLAADIRASDQEYVAYVLGLQRDALSDRIDFTFTDDAHGRMSREEMLMHVITHGVGHRGQVNAVMLLKGLPPATDGFSTYLHTSEARARRPGAQIVAARIPNPDERTPI